jgi:cobyrinic acid a,c-diamide synthase
VLGPRLVVAGTHSGVGKTTIATGLLAALRAAGHRPAGAKVGPDFIDPSYHARASGRPPRNLDPWLCGTDAILPLAARAAAGAEVLVVEGVMGLFDGAADGGPSSTADVARLLDAPVLLVVDAQSMAGSAAPLVHGFATFDPSVRIAGVILNRVGSDTHEIQLREALAPLGVPVLGAVRRDERLTWRDRHLGLVPVAEQPSAVDASLDRLAAAIASQVDLRAALALAQGAAPMPAGPVGLPEPGAPVRLAVAAGPAFTFLYADTVEALEAGGAEVVPFDPLRATALPDAIDGLLIGGGFPEAHLPELTANVALRDAVRAAVDAGLPTWAECGGLLWLCQMLDGHPGVGVVPAQATMTDRLTLGYCIARTRVATPLGPAGTMLRGHEFHYGSVTPGGDALELASRWGARAEGHASSSWLATFLHHHPGGDPTIVAAFLDRCRAR